jgi:hypothetical protein
MLIDLLFTSPSRCLAQAVAESSNTSFGLQHYKLLDKFEIMFTAVGWTTAASGIRRLERHQRVAVQAHNDAETSSLSGKVNDGVNTNAKCNERASGLHPDCAATFEENLSPTFQTARQAGLAW